MKCFRSESKILFYRCVPRTPVFWPSIDQNAIHIYHQRLNSQASPSHPNKVSATVNGKPAFVYFISILQVNTLTPADVCGLHELSEMPRISAVTIRTLLEVALRDFQPGSAMCCTELSRDPESRITGGLPSPEQ